MAKKPNTFYNVTNKTKEEVTIHLYGAVGWDESYWGEGTNNEAWSFTQLLKRLDKEYKKIHLHINSPGGIITEGLAIYNTLRDLSAELHTYNNGLCASMATIIFLAGDVIHHPKTALSHFHRASSWAWGNVNDFEAEIEALKAHETVLIEAISRRCSLSKEEIKSRWLSDGRDYYLTAEQMQELGFVDHITDDDVKPPVEDFSNFKNVIAAYSAPRKGDKKGIFDKIAEVFSPDSAPKNEITKSKNMATKRLKISNVAFAAVMLSYDFDTTEDGGVVLSNEQFETVMKEFDAGQQANKDLETVTAERDSLQAKVNELEAKIAKLPGESAQASDKKDSSVPKTEKVEDYVDPIDEEIAKYGI